MASCPKCSAQAAPGALFCSACGTALTGSAFAETQPSVLTGQEQEQEEDPAEIVVGKNYAYYRAKWDKVGPNTGAASWNWAAFFLGFMWIAHRKMYWLCWIFAGIFAVEFLLEGLFALSSRISNAINLGTAVVVGTQGNYWYRLHVNQKVKDISNQYPPALARSELERQGGTSWLAPFGFIAVVFVEAIVMGLLTGK
ncbi:Protein of unknown function [Polaromonas sp. YR568]|uniref:DUF2628 domain-containing protein n=1 Tax=Polaromonas sp. YR568 TaxID=1855301 RepID=UPI0008F1FF08|nr:DUF2628 domain-containing protein [Polaromonas sp. YR568]SFU47978.1 Protein of unknown function [Polaromonas sp. YR568]